MARNLSHTIERLRKLADGLDEDTKDSVRIKSLRQLTSVVIGELEDWLVENKELEKGEVGKDKVEKLMKMIEGVPAIDESDLSNLDREALIELLIARENLITDIYNILDNLELS